MVADDASILTNLTIRGCLKRVFLIILGFTSALRVIFMRVRSNLEEQKALGAI